MIPGRIGTAAATSSTVVSKSAAAAAVNGPGGAGGNRRQSLGTSIKVLRRAATWKIRSQEKLQAKRERRERRATKTLGIVLGEFPVLKTVSGQMHERLVLI